MNLQKLSEIMTMPLFYNEDFTIDSKYIYDANLYQCGVRCVKDTLSNDGCFNREYVHSAVVYQKYLTRLRELIIFEPWRENYHFSQPS